MCNSLLPLSWLCEIGWLKGVQTKWIKSYKSHQPEDSRENILWYPWTLSLIIRWAVGIADSGAPVAGRSVTKRYYYRQSLAVCTRACCCSSVALRSSAKTHDTRDKSTPDHHLSSHCMATTARWVSRAVIDVLDLKPILS